jgi:sugar phosphate isomerase/epimerase
MMALSVPAFFVENHYSYSSAVIPQTKNNLGLNLGSVQDVLADRPMETINTLTEIGVKVLEFSDVTLLKRLHPILKGAGFEIPSSFFYSPYITGNWNPMEAFGMKIPVDRTFESVVTSAARFGMSHLVMPGIFPEDRGGLDVYKRLSEQMNKAGELCQQANIQLCYHSYSYEFQPMENSSPMAVLLEYLDNSLVKLEADTFWMAIAGIDIMDFLTSNAARIPLVHLADVSANAPQYYRAVTLPDEVYQPPGDGALDFKKIMDFCKRDTVEHAFIHLEKATEPLIAVQKSVQYLQSLNP